jgi:DNA-binding winged helix-turn-helix (wHTH) protein
MSTDRAARRRGKSGGISGEIRGNSVESATTYRCGPFEVDVARRRVSRGAHDVHLTPKAFDLLVLLVRQAPRVLPKREIHEHIWPDTFVSDATLVALVKELRRALRDRDRGAPLIRTVHSVGYAFAVHVDRGGQSQRQAVTASHWLLADGHRMPLREGVNTVGRDSQSDVWLNFASVSRHHARIVVEAGGAWVEDAGSKNGTRVGAAAVDGRSPLQDGDVLSVGRVRVTYRAASAGLSTETEASGTRQPLDSTSAGRRQRPR